MKLVHEFEELTPERRPQDPNLDGTGLRFETMEHGGQYPDAMPQAIRVTDAEGRSCIYVPVTVNGKGRKQQAIYLGAVDCDRCGRLAPDSYRAGPMSATEAPGHKRSFTIATQVHLGDFFRAAAVLVKSFAATYTQKQEELSV